MNLKELKEKINEVNNWIDAKKAEVQERDDNSFSNDEELQEFDTTVEERDNLQRQIDSHERLQKAAPKKENKTEERSIGKSWYHLPKKEPKITYRDAELAFKAYVLTQIGEQVPSEFAEVADKCNINVRSAAFTTDVFERAVSSTDSTSGGALISGSQFYGLEEALDSFNVIEKVAHVVNTPTGRDAHFVKLDDRTNKAPTKVQNADGTSDDPVFSLTNVKVETKVTNIFPISKEVLQDAEQPLLQDCVRWIGMRLAREKDYARTLSSSGNIVGFTTNVGTGVTADAADEFTAEEIIDLYYSVSQERRLSPNCAWMMHSSSLAALHKIREDSGNAIGQFMWANLHTGPLPTLMGKPVYTNDNMAELGDGGGSKVVAFGDWFAYKARNVGAPEIMVANERFIEKYAIGVLGAHRIGGSYVNPGDAPLKLLVTASS